MQKGINGWTFPNDTPIAEAARMAADCGFQAYEPTLEAEGELCPTSNEATCSRLGDAIRKAGLEVASLACGQFWSHSYSDPDPDQRAAAMALTIQGLDRARWLGTDTLLVVPGVVRHPRRPGVMVCSYEDAFARAFNALRELSFEAEARGVMIAIENVWNGFLLSPLEMRTLIDEINSSWVRVYFDVGNVMSFGFPQDWITILSRRIVRVHIKDFQFNPTSGRGFCALGEGDVDWPAVMQALRTIGYDGPLTYEGPGDPADISRRMAQTLQ